MKRADTYTTADSPAAFEVTAMSIVGAVRRPWWKKYLRRLAWWVLKETA